MGEPNRDMALNHIRAICTRGAKAAADFAEHKEAQLLVDSCVAKVAKRRGYESRRFALSNQIRPRAKRTGLYYFISDNSHWIALGVLAFVIRRSLR